ncbi:radical SAM protein [Mesorhizobium sp. C120A]|uniref:radical SAM protein n=1 Tax=unclassified Mesorhizobium TaxID=325217 RepID=UPI0003D00599|nr:MULTISPECIES: radical SAM protein [unclassified Mesorhizobium]ESZ61118.1 radical SAM protein [Mesorhizobium sp. L103C120A0]WJI43573.1 radical SAM protein [Mesorhizobium sp. C120A]
MAGRRILLLEPGYKNKYPPLGLMKLAAYHGPYGKRDEVRFCKGIDVSLKDTAWDRIYVTTLFSFEYKKIAATIDFALEVAGGRADRVFVGGIAASLMTERFRNEPRWSGVRFIKGLLSEAPAIALELDEFAEELYSDDRTGIPIEDLVPDYSILDQTDYEYPVRDAYFAYASRGCIRKCHFCGVPKLEGAQRDVTSLSAIITAIADRHGEKRDLLLMDNNVVASPRFKELVAEIRDLGFAAGARLKRPGERVASQRRVDFNQGVDARILAKDPMYLRELATICLRPLRIAFDHLGLKGPYEKAVRIAHEYGLHELSNYMLYNFHDTPADLFERMRLNVLFNEELGVRIWSFPMRYQPTDRPDRNFVGEKWTRYQLRSMQIILQATHGVVSGEPEFFKRAFGDTFDAFEEILARPHHFIFNRTWYEDRGGRGEFDDYRSAVGRLSSSQRHELLDLVSSSDPSHFHALVADTNDPIMREALRFYVPISKQAEVEIWQAQRSIEADSCSMPLEDRVEDAGLEDDDIGIARSETIFEAA